MMNGTRREISRRGVATPTAKISPAKKPTVLGCAQQQKNKTLVRRVLVPRGAVDAGLKIGVALDECSDFHFGAR
jgi:hypothetical protein